MHTVAAARNQGRPILASPGETWAEAAKLCNLLVARGMAQLCLGPRDALRVIGLDGMQVPAAEVEAREMPGLSDAAGRIYALLGREPCLVEELEDRSGLDPGGAVSALCELELLGLAMQTPGRRYQRV
jgi:predicted Rossmann fold nucleotide-binding protein DprA/Smf involved in DNA uptake